MKRYKKAYIEITNVCNLNCEFCPGCRRPSAFMSPAQFEHVAGQVKPFCDYVYLHLMGEPLLCDGLEDFLKIAERHALAVNITTNGTLISQKSEVLLKAAALRKVSFSLHSFEGNALTEPENYLKQICDFCDRAVQKGVICELRLWNENGRLATLNGRIIEYISRYFGVPCPNAAPGNGTRLRENLYLGSGEVFNWPGSETPDPGRAAFCYGLRDQFGILADGTVVPCCLDNNGEIALGNIFSQPLAEILACERAEAIYEGFSRRVAVEPLCRSCARCRTLAEL